MCNAEPVVSYVLTTKNRAPFLRDALGHLQSIVSPRDELIVVDGGSTDDTLSVINEYRHLVSSYVSEDDHGEAHGFNKGILLARGEFIKVLTDDDVIFPDAMRRVIRILELHHEVDAVLCGGEQYRVDPETGSETLVGYHYLPENRTFSSDPLQMFRTIQCGVGLVFRRRILPLIGLLDTSFRAVDSDFMFRLADGRVNFKYLNLKLFRHNDLPHSGMFIVEECHRDRLRILSRTGRWEEFTNEHTYTPQLIARVLGLNRVRHGRSAMIAILEIERLRRSRFGWLLPPLANGLRIIGAVGRRIMIPFRRPAVMETLRTIEPEWDDALR